MAEIVAIFDGEWIYDAWTRRYRYPRDICGACTSIRLPPPIVRSTGLIQEALFLRDAGVLYRRSCRHDRGHAHVQGRTASLIIPEVGAFVIALRGRRTIHLR